MHAHTLFLMIVVAGMGQRLADGCCFPPRYMIDTVSGVAFGPGYLTRQTGTVARNNDKSIKASRRNFDDVLTGVKYTVRNVQEYPVGDENGKRWVIYDEEDCYYLGLKPVAWGACLPSDYVKTSSIVYGDGTECQTLKADGYLLTDTGKNMTELVHFTENCVITAAKKIYASDGSGYMRQYANFREIGPDEDFGDIFDIPANCTDKSI